MSTVTSVLEHEYFLEFPELIQEKMNIKIGDIFYAYRDVSYTLILSRTRPGKSKYCTMVTFRIASGAVLPYGFLSRMRIRPGDAVEITINHDKIMIEKGTVTPLFHSTNRRHALKIKLKRELEVPCRVFSQSFREDVCSVLALSSWSDNVVSQLLQTPNLLREIAQALHHDDVFSEYFEQRTKELTLDYISKNEKNAL
ncbi:MAG: AbrB/MazE/SpoVT family DNA-binding domain-containing protein [Oscillospiraceae bacterium]|nr:AbrB/MazE/SpoVT family DNA-binding domain-containing protein [Oscillospiraceae bacterium]